MRMKIFDENRAKIGTLFQLHNKFINIEDLINFDVDIFILFAAI